MNKITPPTVGRVVLVYLTDRTLRTKALACRKNDIGQNHPLPALVADVHNDHLVNVGGFDADGKPFGYTSLALQQPGEDSPEGDHAAWMPFQIGQAQKTEAGFDALLAPVLARLLALEQAAGAQALQVFDSVSGGIAGGTQPQPAAETKEPAKKK